MMNKQTCYSILIVAFTMLTNTGFAQKQAKIDSLENLYASGKNDSIRLTALIQLGKIYITSNSPKAEGYARQCIQMAKEKRLDANEASGWNLLGSVFYYRDKFPEALEKYQKALAIFTILKNNKVVATQYRNIGLCYSRMGNYKSAIDYNFRSLRVAEMYHDTMSITNGSNDIGNIFFFQKDFMNAGIYYQKALAIYTAVHNTDGMAREMNNLGSVSSELKKYDKALIFFTQAFDIRKKIKDTSGLMTCLTNIGQLLALNGDLTGALKNDLEALNLAELTHDDYAKANALLCLANAYSDLKNYPKAIEAGEEAIRISESENDPENLREEHNSLFTIYEKAHNSDKALLHYKKYIFYRDSLVNQENTRKSIQSLLLYDFTKKQQADSIHNVEATQVEKLRHDQEINQQKTYTYGGIIGFLLMIIVAGVSFRAYRQKQKANTLVNEQKELVEEKQKEILASIHYAKRIQESLLPTEKYIDKSIERLKKK